MKKLFVMALAVAAMASCSKNEVAEDLTLAKDQITFGKSFIGLSGETRAGGLFSGTSFPTDWDFGVSAWHGTSQVITDDTVSYVATKWEAANGPYYWPAGSGSTDITFVAYAPKTTFPGLFTYTATPVISATGVTAGITVSQTADNNVDFLYSAPQTATKGNPVTIAFKHAMTQVLFECKTAAAYEKPVVVKSIKVNKVNSVGTVTTTTVAGWVSQGTPLSYTFYDAAGITLDENLAQVGSSFVMIPQALNTTGADVTADIVVSVDGVDYTYTGIELAGITNAVTSWDEGKKVKYQISFTLGTIEFAAPTVTDWTENTQNPETII